MYSGQGKYLKKVEVPKNQPGWMGDFGIDARGSLYILERLGARSDPYVPESWRVYKKEPGQGSFEPIGPELNEAVRIEVALNGNFSVLDKTLPSEGDNLRVQKFDSRGKLLKTTGEQHNFDLNMFEFEDEQGHKVNLLKLGGGPEGAQYLVSRRALQKEEVIYEPYLPDGYHYKDNAVKYYYIDGGVVGFDVKGSMYFLRIIGPDIPIDDDQDIIEKESKTEVWVDVIDTRLGEISSVRLEADKTLYGEFATRHFYKVDNAGNIYQLQVDRQGAKVLKYSRR